MTTTLVEFKTIVHRDAVADLARALRTHGVARLWISHVHSVGAGVDPTELRFSSEEEAAFAEKAKVEFIVPADDVDEVSRLVRKHSASDRRGDGVIIVTPISHVTNVRTGEQGPSALI